MLQTAYWHKARIKFWQQSMANLAGLNIINTRPVNRAQPLTDALMQKGALVTAIPLVENIPLALSAEHRQYLLNLDLYDVVFVVSPTAAKLGLALLGDYWPQWPIAVQWLAIGEATAEVLHQYGLQAIVPTQETSEGLLQLPCLQQLQQGQKMLVLRGQGGRNLVRDNLQQQGVKVDYLDLYQRQVPINSQQLWQQQKNSPDLVVITSGEILQSWRQLVGEHFSKIPMVVISKRLVAMAKALGVMQVITAASTRPEDIVHAIQQWHKGQTHDISE